ncbi:hypothetical protein RUND412_002654 [Rhizina undulata]
MASGRFEFEIESPDESPQHSSSDLEDTLEIEYGAIVFHEVSNAARGWKKGDVILFQDAIIILGFPSRKCPELKEFRGACQLLLASMQVSKKQLWYRWNEFMERAAMELEFMAPLRETYFAQPPTADTKLIRSALHVILKDVNSHYRSSLHEDKLLAALETKTGEETTAQGTPDVKIEDEFEYSGVTADHTTMVPGTKRKTSDISTEDELVVEEGGSPGSVQGRAVTGDSSGRFQLPTTASGCLQRLLELEEQMNLIEEEKAAIEEERAAIMQWSKKEVR